MTDDQKVQRLKAVLSSQLDLYRKYKARETLSEDSPGHVDSSYVYDMACEWFNDLPRGAFQDILAILNGDAK